MGSLHETATQRYCRGIDPFNPQPIETDGHSHDIDDAVHRPYLMKAHLINRHLMSQRLGLGQTPKNTLRPIRYLCRKRTTREHGANICITPMVMMPLLVMVMRMLKARQLDRKIDGCRPLPPYPLLTQDIRALRQSQLRQFLLQIIQRQS